MSSDAQSLGERYIAVQESKEFGDLRRTFRGFVFPVTAFFLAWYFLYVLLSMFAPGFMSTKVFGNINIGVILGLGQFVTTFAITIAYVRWASRVLDPQAEAVAAQVGAHGTPEVDG
ncbi:DUF485 domain-containing protein [Janibacter terrae]|jgi:uncharacterized membrane protein (DUF485 family)|uniref:DUF485 domain-containing protein n=1 Tax=Janibacter terrae TaxID=103817 RepID=A0ABZ2F9P3_9MICO|nr:DUF485 domain-containing protein [Janibacter terrae]MBA4085778.1 DUF485 domain-containing protein [Kytococcus sp.]HBO54418.1 DUF485 domain-containing protein [Janibacter terrae]